MTEQDFLSAILAAPDDPTPKLVFADWLEDRGLHNEAEAIRLGASLTSPAREENKQWLTAKENALVRITEGVVTGDYYEEEKRRFMAGWLNSLGDHRWLHAWDGRFLVWNLLGIKRWMSTVTNPPAEFGGRTPEVSEMMNGYYWQRGTTTGMTATLRFAVRKASEGSPWPVIPPREIV